MCSICSSCPAEYSSTPCGATTDSRCVKEFRLELSSIVAIVLAAILVVSVVAVVTFRLRAQKARQQTELGETLGTLEDTVRELDDFLDVNERMEQAWVIPESDLVFGPVLGVGGFGRVVSGMWGYVPTLCL